MSGAPRVVCFDLGNVLVRICRSWAEGCRAAGLPADDRFDRLFAADARWPKLERAYQCGALTFDEFTREAARIVSGVPDAPDAEAIARVHRAWILGEDPQAAELLRELVGRGLVVAVLSNTCAEHWPILQWMRFMQYVHVPLGSHLIRACKPEAEAYAAIEERTGARKGEILFFDDLPANVAAAADRGWRSEQVIPGADAIAGIRERLREHGAGNGE